MRPTRIPIIASLAAKAHIVIMRIKGIFHFSRSGQQSKYPWEQLLRAELTMSTGTSSIKYFSSGHIWLRNLIVKEKSNCSLLSLLFQWCYERSDHPGSVYSISHERDPLKTDSSRNLYPCFDCNLIYHHTLFSISLLIFIFVLGSIYDCGWIGYD